MDFTSPSFNKIPPGSNVFENIPNMIYDNMVKQIFEDKTQGAINVHYVGLNNLDFSTKYDLIKNQHYQKYQDQNIIISPQAVS